MSETSLPSLDGDDGLSRLDDAHGEGRLESEPDSVVDVGLPLGGVDPAGLGVVERVAASVEVDLSRRLLVSGDGEDGDLRSVLGDESGGVSGGGEDEDGSGVLLHGGGDGGDGEGLGGLGRSGGEVPEVGEEGLQTRMEDKVSLGSARV